MFNINEKKTIKNKSGTKIDKDLKIRKKAMENNKVSRRSKSAAMMASAGYHYAATSIKSVDIKKKDGSVEKGVRRAKEDPKETGRGFFTGANPCSAQLAAYKYWNKVAIPSSTGKSKSCAKDDDGKVIDKKCVQAQATIWSGRMRAACSQTIARNPGNGPAMAKALRVAAGGGAGSAPVTSIHGSLTKARKAQKVLAKTNQKANDIKIEGNKTRAGKPTAAARRARARIKSSLKRGEARKELTAGMATGPTAPKAPRKSRAKKAA